MHSFSICILICILLGYTQTAENFGILYKENVFIYLQAEVQMFYKFSERCQRKIQMIVI